MQLPKQVKIVEVGPRDGLQNESRSLPAKVRADLIELLTDAGLKVIEVGSFVSPRKVPQLAETAAVLRQLTDRPGVSYPVLVPNEKGLALALAAGAKEIAVFAAASESFSQKNINCSLEASLRRYAAVAQKARAEGLRVRGYVSCALGCPYEGQVAPETVAEVAGRLFELGCYQVSLGDTIGVGTPLKVQRLLEAVGRRVQMKSLAGHFHDTYGQALANVLTALQCGLTVFDSSVAGLGGCPFAPGAAGNLASEDLLYLLDGLGIETGVDLGRLLAASRFICGKLGRQPDSRVARALAGKEKC